MTTKQYLRFSPADVFGVIASSSASIVSLEPKKSKDVFFAVPACENVYLWNLHSKEKVNVLRGETSSVTSIVADSKSRNLAVGYADGMIRLFDLKTNECTVSFIGHKSAVSCLTFEENGSNLASGGKDSEIVVWNATDEAGLFRLKGHKGSVTECRFFIPKNLLISSSKDTYIKFWDLDTQHCFYTLVGSRHEILDFALVKETRLIVGVNSVHLKVWSLNFDQAEIDEDPEKKIPKVDVIPNPHPFLNDDFIADDDNSGKVNAVEIGELVTIGDKTVSIVVDSSERVIGLHASTKNIQLFKILNQAEQNKKIRKRRNKELKRKKENDEEEVATESGIADEFLALETLRMVSKVDSFTLTVNEADIAKITILLKNNSVVQYNYDLKAKGVGSKMCSSIILPGHRSIVRTLSYSTDSQSLLSASDDSIKIWRSLNEEQMCANTMDCNAALCSVFVTGDSHCIIGTKTGKLNIFDVNTRELLESLDAHDGTINCLTTTPDLNGVTSGGSDKEIKFWDFELVSDEDHMKKRLSLSQTRSLKMPDQILCLKYSPDNKKLAISLLDYTVQIVFADSLKLAFSLYGHALPVTCMDISHDSSLIATGSEDKDIRVWSMEFGSCNKFLKRAHDKGITCLQFLPKTHLFFTGGRDNMVKQWDADNFQKILTLKGHQHEVTAMTMSPDGTLVVTASRDKSLRCWEKTAEPLVLQEEQDNEREEQDNNEDLPVIPGESNKEVALSGMKTTETIRTVDQLIEAVKIYNEELQKYEDHKLECQNAGKELPLPTAHPLLVAFRASSPLDYMRKVFRRIKSSELEGTLLHLPFNYVLDILKVIGEFVDRGWEIELCEKCASFLVRIHFGQILSAQHFQPVIEKLKDKLFSRLYHMRDMAGFAKIISGLQQRTIDAREEVSMFTGALEDMHKRKKKAKRKLERSVISFV